MRRSAAPLCPTTILGMTLLCSIPACADDSGMPSSTGSTGEPGATTGTTGDETTAAAPTSTGPTSTTSTSTASTSAGDTTGGDTSSLTTDESGGAMCPPADGTGCDIYAQDCAPCQKCTAYADNDFSPWNANQCVPLKPDPAQPGEPCILDGSPYNGLDDCDVDSYCWDFVFGSPTTGTCVALCDGDAMSHSCKDPDALCDVINDVLPLCLERCDPLMSDCSQPEHLCVPQGENEGFVCVFTASDEGQIYAPCGNINSCDPGLACRPSTTTAACDVNISNSCCVPYCDLEAPDPNAPCTGGDQCVPFFEPGPAPVGDEDVGVCATPP